MNLTIDINKTDSVIDRFKKLKNSIPRGIHPRHAALIHIYYDGTGSMTTQLHKLTHIRREYIYLVAVWAGYQPKKKDFWLAEDEQYLMEKYGARTISFLAKKFKRSRKAVFAKARRLGLNQIDNQGMYTVNKLSKVLNISDKNVIYQQWIPRGLYVSNSFSNHYIMVDPVHLIDFWQEHPEAFDYMSLSDQTKVLLGVTDEHGRMRIPLPPEEKKLLCKRLCVRDVNSGRLNTGSYVNKVYCHNIQWEPLYNRNVRCNRCGSALSPWAVDYRGVIAQVLESKSYDDVNTSAVALGW